MAYMSKENKAVIAENLKVALKDSGLKYSLRVTNNSGITMTIRSGKTDFFGDMLPDTKYDRATEAARVVDPNREFRVNTYYINEHFSGDSLDYLLKIKDIMMKGNYNNSDVMTDYFDIGWYIDINIGSYDKPYVLVK